MNAPIVERIPVFDVIGIEYAYDVQVTQACYLLLATYVLCRMAAASDHQVCYARPRVALSSFFISARISFRESALRQRSMDMEENDIWYAISAYFHRFGIVRHQIESYDNF